jgi:hypothetical protein
MRNFWDRVQQSLRNHLGAARTEKTRQSPEALLAGSTCASGDRLPRGFGIKRLMDLPMAWSDQWSALGLKDPAQATFSSAI